MVPESDIGPQFSQLSRVSVLVLLQIPSPTSSKQNKSQVTECTSALAMTWCEVLLQEAIKGSQRPLIWWALCLRQATQVPPSEWGAPIGDPQLSSGQVRS